MAAAMIGKLRRHSAAVVTTISNPGLVPGLLLCCLGVVQASAQTPNMADNANLVYQLQQLQDEIRALRGMVEEQSFELESIRRRQRDQYLELDQRLTAVASSAPAAAAEQQSAPAVAGSGNGVSQNNPSEPPSDLPELRQPLRDERQITTVAQPEIGPSTSIAAPPASEQQAYEQAFDALKALRYSESAGLFRDFLQQYPDSELSPNAHYWLGESNYASGNYDLALEAFNRLLDDHPGSSKAGDALLKIGYTYYEKQDWNQARAALEQVKLQHAGTALERLADSRLRAMRADGHL